MTRYRRILHPTDFSPSSRAAFARAVRTARENKAELIVLHVMAPLKPVTSDEVMSPRLYEEIERTSRQYAQKELARLVAGARKAGVRVRPLLLEGTAADQIVRAARSQRADVVVVGTHGRTGLSRLFLGSVAERVVGMAPCPVLTVRGQRK